MQVYAGTPILKQTPVETRKPSQPEKETNFQSILQDNMRQTDEIVFSRHANTRLSSRELSLSDDQLKRVEGAIAKAHEKGIRDSLVLVDDVALVVNVKNRLVVTAMGQGNNVFTNIDGAVIV